MRLPLFRERSEGNRCLEASDLTAVPCVYIGEDGVFSLKG